jgi:hypothetical protein
MFEMYDSQVYEAKPYAIISVGVLGSVIAGFTALSLLSGVTLAGCGGFILFERYKHRKDH